MSDQPAPAPRQPVQPVPPGRFDAFMALQGVVVLALTGIACVLVVEGDHADAMLIATGLIGALSLNRRSG
jgi:hypothetical protein